MLVFLIITAVGLAADLVSKHLVFERLIASADHLPQRVEDAMLTLRATTQRTGGTIQPKNVLSVVDIHRDVMPGLDLTLSANSGVVFGWQLPRWLVAVATVATMALVVFFFATSPRGAWWLQVAMAFILAGALGNLYDRMFSEIALPGGAPPIRYHVRDFINCSEIGWDYIFNVADVWLVVGVAMLMVHWWRTGRAERRARSQAQTGDNK